MASFAKTQLAFSLIEVMVVVTMIGGIATISMPYYQSYVAKIQAKEAENMIAFAGAQVTAMAAQKTCTPDGQPSVRAGKYGTLTISGSFVERLGTRCRSSCTATYQFGNESSGLVQGKKVTVDILSSGEVSKVVSATTLPSEFLTDQIKQVAEPQPLACTTVTPPSAVAQVSETVAAPPAVTPPPSATPPRYIFTERPIGAGDTPLGLSPTASGWLYYRGQISGNAIDQSPPKPINLTTPSFTIGYHIEPYSYTAALVVGLPGQSAKTMYTVQVMPYTSQSYVGLHPVTNNALVPDTLFENIFIDNNQTAHRKLKLTFSALPEDIFNSYSSITVKTYNYSIDRPYGGWFYISPYLVVAPSPITTFTLTRTPPPDVEGNKQFGAIQPPSYSLYWQVPNFPKTATYGDGVSNGGFLGQYRAGNTGWNIDAFTTLTFNK